MQSFWAYQKLVRIKLELAEKRFIEEDECGVLNFSLLRALTRLVHTLGRRSAPCNSHTLPGQSRHLMRHSDMLFALTLRRMTSNLLLGYRACVFCIAL